MKSKKIFFSYLLTKTYVVGTQKNHLNEWDCLIWFFCVEKILEQHPKHNVKTDGLQNIHNNTLEIL